MLPGINYKLVSYRGYILQVKIISNKSYIVSQDIAAIALDILLHFSNPQLFDMSTMQNFIA